MIEFRRLWVGLLCGLVLVFGVVAHAQDEDATLALGQPVSMQIERPGQTLDVAYELAESSMVTLQVLGLDAAPNIVIQSAGETVAGDSNAAGAPSLTLTTFLDAGDYVVQVGTVDDVPGTVVLVLQDEAASEDTPLVLGEVVTADVSAEAPRAVYSFATQAEALYLFVVSGWPEQGPIIQLANAESGQVSVAFAGDLGSGFLRIPAGSTRYQVMVTYTGLHETEAYQLCVISFDVPGCASIGEAVVSGQIAATTAPESSIDYTTLTYARAEDGGYIIGDPDAPITIVYFSDYACPHCQNYEPTIVRLIEDYVVTGQAQLEYRIFPTAGGQQTVFTGGIADCLGDDQPSAFWIARERFSQLAEAGQYADAARIVANELDVSYTDLLTCQQESTRVQLDMALGQEVGIQGTPAIAVRYGDAPPEFITYEGQVYDRGGVPFEVLSAVIEAAQTAR
ncbi:MAG: thioredoxin domain-containing protein [Anaerolineae bacterium]|nr:thioredoxin domain-containing protein [Anaerolineae bacterium]